MKFLVDVVLLLANLPQLEALLRRGGVVVFDRGRVRVRRLPIGGEDEDLT